MTEITCPLVLALGAAWAVISAIFVLVGIAEEARKWAWFWAVSFAASSLVAACCFGTLAWGA